MTETDPGPFGRKPHGPPPPTVGRAVHYVARGSLDGVFPPACRAATVTQAGAWVDGEIITHGNGRERMVTQTWQDDAVHLHVMNPTGTFTYGPMAYDWGHGPADGVMTHLCDGRVHEPGSWHWPARIGD